jgi:hypothetical protein
MRNSSQNVRLSDVWSDSETGVLGCITERSITELHASHPSLGFKLVWAIGRTAVRVGNTMKSMYLQYDEIPRDLSFLPPDQLASWR